MIRWSCVVGAFILTTRLLSAADVLIIAENGEALAEIVLDKEPSAIVAFAAQELKAHLDKMTGGDFKITHQPTAGIAIRLGQSPEATAAGLEPEKLKPDGFLIRATDRDLFIVGQDNPSTSPISLWELCRNEPRRGTLMGVYTFLEQLGVRWPAPGPANECVPKNATLRIPVGLQKHEPVFTERVVSGIWDFMNKIAPAGVEPVFPDAQEYCRNTDDAFLWSLRLKMSTSTQVQGCHSENALQLKKIWPDHPERFALINGQRNFEYSCWTDPAIADIWKRAADAYFSGDLPKDAGLSHLSGWDWHFRSPDEFMIDPMDHYAGCDGQCRCDRCNAFREKYPCDDDTEILWRVIADVAQFVAEKHPGKFISTLIYPPKTQMPHDTPLPDNIRIRVCMSGPGVLPVPKRMQAEQEQVRRWAKAMGGRLLLWTYQVETAFGRKLPGMPETYPHLIADFLKMYRSDIGGMFFEVHALNHTFRNRDMYIATRFLWNPDRDIEHELADYYAALYGPAAAPAAKLFQRFEDNWIRYYTMVTPNQPKGETLGVANPVKELRNIVWTKIYTPEEMNAVDDMITAVEQAAVSDPVYAKRVALIRTWIFDVMKKERSAEMDTEENRQKIVARVPRVVAVPTADDWARAPVYPLISAYRMNSALAATGQFRLLRSSTSLFLMAELNEPEMAKSLTRTDRKDGDTFVWEDNDVELFLYSVSSGDTWQIMINDRGNWTSKKDNAGVSEWVQRENFQAQVSSTAGGWSVLATIPLDPSDSGEMRFNLCRSRKIQEQPNELSTWSPLAMVGTWQNPDYYGTLVFDTNQP